MDHSKKTIILVSGSWPPQTCGVGDYMYGLSLALKRSNFKIETIRICRYSFLYVLFLIIKTYVVKNVFLVISYPTEGYGKSVVPFAFFMASTRKTMIHIHEYRSKNIICKFLLRFFRRMKYIFFSNSIDLAMYKCDTNTTTSNKDKVWEVVPSPSNIPVFYEKAKNNIKLKRIIYFGQIRPNKGIEILLDVYREVRKEHSDIDLVIVGAVPTGYSEYAEKIREVVKANGILLFENLTPKEISEQLSISDIAFLPYPDGADERRGSLKAALLHKVICVTTHSKDTPDEIASVTIGLPVYSNQCENFQPWVIVAKDKIIDTLNSLNSSDVKEMSRMGFEVASNNSFDAISNKIDTITTVNRSGYGC